ncbi:DUF3604 domain-containing protein, partial [Candidatus Hydrogenedentota bacterium]
QDFTITVCLGREGLAPGDEIQFTTPRGLQSPQWTEPSRESFISIHYRDAKFFISRVKKPDGRGVWYQNRLSFKVESGSVPKGAKLKIEWRNPHVGNLSPNLAGNFLDFEVLIERGEELERVRDCPRIQRVPAEAEHLLVIGRSNAVIGQPARVTVVARDRFNNPALSYCATVTFSSTDPKAVLPEFYTFTKEDSGCHTFTDGFKFATEGIHYITVEEDEELADRSNPIECTIEEQGLKLYWGDLHVHSDKSRDARQGASAVGTYSDLYRNGRDFHALDFQANTDHNNDDNYGPEDWPEMKRTTNSYNEPGRFATIQACENSGATGDKNVYFRGSDSPYIESDNVNDPIALFSKIKDLECITVPHHIGQAMRPTDWRPEFFDKRTEKLIEIYSDHGLAEYYGNFPHHSYWKPGKDPDVPWHQPTLKGRNYRDALAMGYRCGIIAASDDHKGAPGSYGLAGVWAEELTREAVYDALRARRCYGTNNPRIILKVHVNGHPMGSEITGSDPPTVSVDVATPARIEQVEIIKNGKTAHVRYRPSIYGNDPEESNQLKFEWTDDDFTDSSNYYVRVLTEPEQPDPYYDRRFSNAKSPRPIGMAWSSPVWVDKK